MDTHPLPPSPLQLLCSSAFSSVAKRLIFAYLFPAILCQLPQDSGLCTTTTQPWYFNSLTNACQQFTYTGCLGNPNRFDNRALCEARCGGRWEISWKIWNLKFLWFNMKSTSLQRMRNCLQLSCLIPLWFLQINDSHRPPVNHPLLSFCVLPVLAINWLSQHGIKGVMTFVRCRELLFTQTVDFSSPGWGLLLCFVIEVSETVKHTQIIQR